MIWFVCIIGVVWIVGRSFSRRGGSGRGHSGGLKRLCEVSRPRWAEPAEQVCQAVVDDLRQFVGDQVSMMI